MKFIKKLIKKFLLKYFGYEHHLIEKKTFLIGKTNSKNNKKISKIDNLADVEFSVFSQWGDDGIIDWIINNIGSVPKIFLEIGTQNYTESNTRFLLKLRNWKGYLIDSSKDDILNIKNQSIYWQYDLTVSNYFVNKENINHIVKKLKIRKNIGLLSLDIDGIDYWVWKELSEISPAVLVCEFNSVLGDVHDITVPYRKNFDRKKIHHSNLFFGASLCAFKTISKKKGYEFIGTNSNGVNAYFVKKKYYKLIKNKIKKKLSYFSVIRESRNFRGKKNYLAGINRLKKIEELEVFDLKKKKLVKLVKFHQIYSKRWKENI